MKRIQQILAVLAVTFLLNAYATQAQSPVYFPDGVVVGAPASGSGSVTTPAGYKMYVSTGILAEKVRVAAASGTFWADFVFSPDYRLRPLTEVERFIQLNKHLPDVPSAASVEKEGFDLGQNQAILLQKIEELTLYVIQQQKQIDKLQKQVKTLRTKK
jgi:hypothetical protein